MFLDLALLLMMCKKEQLLHKTLGSYVPHVLQCLLKQTRTIFLLHDPFIGGVDIFNLWPLQLADQRNRTAL